MIQITRVSSPTDIESIAELQRLNLKRNLPASIAEAEGFLTAEYSLDFLRRMNDSSPAIIAADNGELVGYALVATQSTRYDHPLLQHLFEAIDTLSYKGRLLSDSLYVVVGQLCVAKAYRGLGLVNRLYDHFAECMTGDYQYIVTDVAEDNQRSLRAHLKAGFEVLHRMEYGGAHWNIVLRDLSNATLQG